MVTIKIKIKNYLLKALTLIIIVCCVTACLACSKDSDIVKSGIEVVTTTASYTQAERETAKETLYGFLKKYYQTTVSINVPKSVDDEFKTFSVAVEDIISKENLSSQKYVQLFSEIKGFTDNVSSVNDYVSGNLISGNAILKGFINKFVKIVGMQSTGSILYELSVYYYDYCEQSLLKDYQKYGFSYLLQDSFNMAENKRILQEEITKQNYLKVTSLFYMFSDLFLGGAFDGGITSNLTEKEILILLKTPDVSEIEITSGGWKLLIEMIVTAFQTDEFAKELFKKSQLNGDLTKNSCIFNHWIKMINIFQSKIDKSDVKLITSGNYQAFISSLFGRFDEGDWVLFESATSLDLNVADYDAIAFSYYGSDYESFKTSKQKCNLSQLKSAVGSEEFNSLLTGYIINLCPAFLYGVL